MTQHTKKNKYTKKGGGLISFIKRKLSKKNKSKTQSTTQSKNQSKTTKKVGFFRRIFRRKKKQ